MNDDSLRQWLQEADADAVIGGSETSGLIPAVRHKLQQRRQNMLAGVLASAAVLVIIGVGAGLNYRSMQQRQVAVVQGKIMRAQIAMAADYLQRMLEEEQLRRSGAEESEVADPARQIETHVDEAAFALMYQAQRMAENYNDKETAVQLYRQVTEHFAQTPWAGQAAEKIAEMQPNQI